MTTGAGHLNAYAIGILVDLRRLEKLRQKILSVRTAVSQFNQSFRGKGIGTSIKNIEALTVSLQKLGTVAKTASAGVVSSQAKVTSALKLSGETTGKYAHAFTQYNRNVLGMSRGTKNAFTDMFRRVALWSAGVGLLFGVISKVRTIFKGMQDLEESMTELKKVMDDSTPWARAQSSIINTAKTFSIAATEVSKIAQVWAQQGKTLSEVTELTKTAALGMNSANLTATQSVEFLTSATKAYNIEASQTERIIDGIMKVQSDFAITSENLAKGFNVAGALAAKAQVDMGGLFGMMTAIGEVTRETGNTIGNSLKTQFARLQNPATIAYLQQFGIQMKEIEAGTNRIRRLSPSQIFKQIADLSRTGQIDTDAVIDIALKIGGIRKFKDALILIERFGVAEEARAKFLLAYNDAQRANDLVQENLTRKTEKLNTAFLDLGVALSDQGLYTGLKNIIDFSTKIVEGATRAARTPTGERLLKLGGIAILAKAVTSLSKVILAGTVRGTLKGAAVAATGTGGVTTAQQAQLQAYTESQRRSQLELEKLAISSKRTRAGLMEVARSSNTTLSVAIKKLSIEAAGAGREFNAARFTFKKFWADMKIGAKTFWLGATASIQKGSGIPTAGKAAGLGAVGIGSRVTGILKGGLQVAAWMAAMEAVFFLWDKFFGEQEQTKSILRKTIDTESQATQAVLELSSAYEENRVAAKDAGRAVKSYVESLTFIDRFDQATVAAKKLAAAVRAGTITTQQELKKFLEDKVKLKDIKTLEEAQEIAIKYRNFLKYELAGGLQEGLTILNKTTSEALSDFNDIILSAGAKGVTFGKAFNPRGPAPFTIESVGGETEGALVTIWKDAVKSMGKDWSKFVVDVTKEGGLPTSTSDTTVDFSKATLALIKELNTHGRTIRLGDRTQAQGFSEFTQSQIYFADSLIKFAGLAKETIGSRAGVEGADTEAPTPQELVRQDLVRASRAAALKLQEQLKLPEGLLDDIIQLETIFPRAVGDWVDALYGGLYAMVKAEDLIWKATNKFVTDQEKIQIKERLAGTLGLKRTGVSDDLKVTQDFFTTISTVRPSIEKAIRNVKFLQESIRTAIPDTAGANFKSLVARFTDQLDDPVAANQFLKAVSEFNYGREGDKALAEKAGKEIVKIGGRLIEAQAELAKLTDIGGDFNIKLKDLWTNLLSDASTFGLSATDEAGIKRVAESLGSDSAEVVAESLIESLDFAGAAIAPKIKKVADDIFGKSLPGLASKLNSATNKVRSSLSQLLLTGNRFIDAQIKAATNLQNVINTFDTKASSLATQRELGNIEEKNFLAKSRQLKVEKEIAVAYAEANIQIQDQLILQQDIIETTNSLKSSLTAMLSDVSNFTDFTGRAVGDMFTDVAGQRLEYQVTALFDNIFAGIEADIGAGILGLEKVELTPEQAKMIASIDTNTSEVDLNNTLLGDVNISLINLTNALVTETTKKTILGGARGATGVGELADISGIKPIVVKFDSKIPQSVGAIDAGDDATKAAFDLQKSITQLVTNLGGGLIGNAIADSMGKESNRVNAGVGIGGMIGGLLPIPGGDIIGSLLGGLFGGLLGTDKEKEERAIQEDIRKIADNTAELVAVDKRLINAPAGLTLPATATAGGAITYNLSVSVDGSGDTVGVANEVVRQINQQLGTSSTNFNRVGDTLY